VRVISWFSGIGGFDLALLRAGHEIVGACEIEPFCRRVYEARFGRPSWFPTDIRKVKADDIPEADLWCAGSPCQDFSIAGKRAGLEGERSGLLRTWTDLAARVRPRWLILENVPGFLTVHGGRDFGEFTARLDELGYVGAGATLDARYFGVPQRRRRVFVVGCLGDGARPGEVLAESASGERDPAARLEARAGAAGGPAGGAQEAGELAASLRAADGHHGRSSPRGDGADTLVVASTGQGHFTDLGGVAGTLSAHAAKEKGDHLVCGPILSPTRRAGGRIGAEEAASGHIVIQDASGLEHKKQNGLGVMEADEAYTIDASRRQAVFAKGRHAHTDDDYETWEEAQLAPTLTETEIRLGVMAFDWQSGSGKDESFRGKARNYVVRAGDYTGAIQAQKRDAVAFNIVPESGQGADLQASETDIAMALSTEEAKKYERGTRIVSGGVRRLTPLECERLQGFPDGWTCLCGAKPYSTSSCRCPDGPRYRALGNSLAVPVVSWIAARLAGE
jgi:DNA (cytosine-5)-methyltransferase 1